MIVENLNSSEIQGKGLNSTEAEETETQLLDEVEKSPLTEDEIPENEPMVDETKEVTSEENYPEQMQQKY